MPVEYIRRMNTRGIPMVITNMINVPRSNYNCYLQQMAENHSNGYFYTDAWTIRANKDCSNMFESMTTLKGINMVGFDFQNTTNMSGMFHRCFNLQTIEGIDNWNVSNVSDFSGMFRFCRNLSADLSSWNVSNANIMADMFGNGAMPFDLSSWDMSNVRHIDAMFYNANISGSLFAMNLSSCTLNHLFTVATTVNTFNNWNLNNCTGTSIFWGLNRDITVSNWNITNSDLDTGTDRLAHFLNVNIYNVNITNSNVIFGNLSNININGLNVVNGNFRFGVSNVATINANNMFIDDSNISNLCRYAYNLNSVNIHNFTATNSPNATYQMFRECFNLISVNLDSLNIRNTSLYFMFAHCNNLVSVNISNSYTENISDASGLFYNCKNLETVSGMTYMNYNRSSGTDFREMFVNCIKLNSNVLHDEILYWMYPANFKNISYMFAHCSNLTYLDFSGWDTYHATDFTGMFWNCNNLRKIWVPYNFVRNTDNQDPFSSSIIRTSTKCKVFLEGNFEHHNFDVQFSSSNWNMLYNSTYEQFLQA